MVDKLRNVPHTDAFNQITNTQDHMIDNYFLKFETTTGMQLGTYSANYGDSLCSFLP